MIPRPGRPTLAWHRWLIAASSLVLWGACSSDDAADPTTASDEAGANHRPEGTLRIADFTDVTTFDPALAQNTQSAHLYPVYDTLVRQSPDRELVPHLATAWTQVDPTTLRLTLRDDVVFHDGSRFDAAVVKANLERAKATAGNPNAVTYLSMSEVVVVDATTVEVRFSAPEPTFLLELSLVQGMMVSPAAIAAGTDLAREPHGSGGWIWNRADSQDGVRQVFDLNPEYWARELQGVERLEISVVADNNARFNALRTGQVDLIYGATPAQIDEATDEGLQVLTLDVDAHFVLITDRGGKLAEPLAEPSVRRAIGHAIDRQGYVDAILDGVGSPSGGLVSPALTAWYDDSLATVPRFDPRLARALLAEAGYPDGFEITMPTLPLLQSSNEAITQMLRDVGIRVQLAQLQSGQLGPEMRSGSFAAAFSAATQYHPHQFFRTFLSGRGTFNPFGLDDTRRIDEALASAAKADPATAKQLYAEVQREAIDAGIMIPIAFAPVVNVAAAHVMHAFIPLGSRNAVPYGLQLDEP